MNFNYYDHCLSRIVISNIRLLLLDVIVHPWLIIFDLSLLYTSFSFQCWWLWETTNRLKSINKCFMYITHDCKSNWRHLQQEDKRKLCIVIHAKINYIPIYQNQPVCLKQMLNYQRLWAWCQLCYISQELILFTYNCSYQRESLREFYRGHFCIGNPRLP